MRQILFYLPFAVIVLFQHEIRRGLARMGSNPLLALFVRVPAMDFEPIIRAAEMLSAKQIGECRRTAAIAKPIDAVVTAELLVSIFTPGGPLHDGAVIIHGNRIVAAGAVLPLTVSGDSAIPHGTRHRAALGVSEDSDALVIVISEENGSIAAATEGVLHETLDRRTLLALMNDRLRTQR